MLVLADPEFSGEQCSPGSLIMRWSAVPSIELYRGFGGTAPVIFDFYTRSDVIWQ